MMIYVVSTCIPDRGEKPCLPNVFATLLEAEAFADQMLRNEWENAPMYAEDDEGQERPLPYPGDWREANDTIAASYDDGSWGEWELSAHEIASPIEDALSAAEHWLAEEAASPHPGQTRPDDILRVIREALGKPHDAPDATPAAPQTPDASALMLEALRLAAERIEINNYGGEEDEHLAVIRAAIATGEA